MVKKQDENLKDGVKPYVPVLVAIIVTFGATFGANSVLLHNAVVEVDAPDRFTGTQAAELRTKIEQRLAALTADVNKLRSDLDKLPPRELTDRILRLELEVAQLRRDIEACCMKNHNNKNE